MTDGLLGPATATWVRPLRGWGWGASREPGQEALGIRASYWWGEWEPQQALGEGGSRLPKDQSAAHTWQEEEPDCTPPHRVRGGLG